MNLKFNKIDLIFKKFQKFYSFYTSQKYTKTNKLQKIQFVGSKLPRGICWKQILISRQASGHYTPWRYQKKNLIVENYHQICDFEVLNSIFYKTYRTELIIDVF